MGFRRLDSPGTGRIRLNRGQTIERRAVADAAELFDAPTPERPVGFCVRSPRPGVAWSALSWPASTTAVVSDLGEFAEKLGNDDVIGAAEKAGDVVVDVVDGAVNAVVDTAETVVNVVEDIFSGW
jgi:hypothetical protein